MNATEIQYIPSDAAVVRAVPKSFDHPYGVMPVDAITADVPTIVVLSGDLSYLPRHANHYIKEIRQVFVDAGVQVPEIYATYYTFGSRDAYTERIQMFRAAGHKIINLNRDEKLFEKRAKHNAETEPNPLYIERLFEIIIRPIITGDVAQIEQKAQNLRFYAHSHGGAVLRMLESKMKAELKKMNMPAKQIQTIMQRVVAVQHGPIAPLENPDFTTLTFASASDFTMDTQNQFSEYIHNHSEDVYPSYFSQNDAHLFVVSQISKNMASEHNGTGLKLADSDILTEDGKVLFAAERNAIINSVRTTDVPNVAVLVHGEAVDFESMKHSGDWFYKMMLADIRSQMQQNPKRGNQK